MHFDYEIPSEEYVAAQLLYYRLTTGRTYTTRNYFHCEPTIFIFGKKYLTSEQQEELRRLFGLSASHH
jgi:hypothetical protein